MDNRALDPKDEKVLEYLKNTLLDTVILLLCVKFAKL